MWGRVTEGVKDPHYVAIHPEESYMLDRLHLDQGATLGPPLTGGCDRGRQFR